MEDLQTELSEALERNGAMGHLRAGARAAALSALADHSSMKPDQHPMNTLLNELIREYLEFNGMEASLSVFTEESGINSEHRMRRRLAAFECGLGEKAGTDVRLECSDGRPVPLLYELAAYAKQMREHRATERAAVVATREQRRKRDSAFEVSTGSGARIELAQPSGSSMMPAAVGGRGFGKGATGAAASGASGGGV